MRASANHKICPQRGKEWARVRGREVGRERGKEKEGEGEERGRGRETLRRLCLLLHGMVLLSRREVNRHLSSFPFPTGRQTVYVVKQADGSDFSQPWK